MPLLQTVEKQSELAEQVSPGSASYVACAGVYESNSLLLD